MMIPTPKRYIFLTLVSLFFIYSLAVYTTGTATDRGVAMISERSRRGKLLFQKYNCTACHQLYGLGGYMGPDLTNVIFAKGKGPVYARAFLQSGTQRMPDFHMSAEEMDDIVAYLTYVDRTGISPVTDFKINSDGTISQR
jgi:nitric oxide reductase subunit C